MPQISEERLELLQKRKGARSLKEVPDEVRELLEAGVLESKNLMEFLSVDPFKLLLCISKEAPLEAIVAEIESQRDIFDSKSKMEKHRTIGFAMAHLYAIDDARISSLKAHKSDLVRCWVSICLGQMPNLTEREALQLQKPFATDSNAGVREIAWLSVRERVVKNPVEYLKLLQVLVVEPEPFLRRFACELTRPRGVWCKHIELLKDKPELAECLLEKLMQDESKYVQDSVANWINDASKSNPEWALNFCERWLKASNHKNTKRICERGLRSVRKLA